MDTLVLCRIKCGVQFQNDSKKPKIAECFKNYLRTNLDISSPSLCIEISQKSNLTTNIQYEIE